MILYFRLRVGCAHVLHARRARLGDVEHMHRSQSDCSTAARALRSGSAWRLRYAGASRLMHFWDILIVYLDSELLD